jgi:hypothetical protein
MTDHTVDLDKHRARVAALRDDFARLEGES